MYKGALHMMYDNDLFIDISGGHKSQVGPLFLEFLSWAGNLLTLKPCRASETVDDRGRFCRSP